MKRRIRIGFIRPLGRLTTATLALALGITPALANEPLEANSDVSTPGLPGLDPDHPISASRTKLKPGVYLRARPLAARHDECQNCHMQKSFNKIPDKKKTLLEHNRSDVMHGNKVISCNFCHDRNNHNFLRSSVKSPADFANTSGVCRQCHAETYKGWSDGLHGKRVGGWNNTKIQLNCIDCHNPHNVAFKKMKARPQPPTPKLAIPKAEESH